MSDDENKKIKITKVLDAAPAATKHTVPNGQKHLPVDSLLVRKETTEYFRNWLANRKGSQFPIDIERSSEGSINIFSSSATCSTDLNPAQFRETAGILKEDGSVLPIHVLPHNNEERHLERLKQERASQQIKCKLQKE